MVESNNSIQQYYIRLQSMYQTALNMVTAINQSLSTKASEIVVNVADTDDTTTTVRIPSFLYLESKIEQLDNNFNNLFSMPASGEAWFNKSSDMYKLKMVKSSSAPLSPVLSTGNVYASIKDNNFLKDLVSPKTFLKINIDNLPDNIEKMLLKKYVIFSQDMYELLNSKGVGSYEDFQAAIYNYKTGVDYEVYDSEINLPIRKDLYKGEFKIVEIPDLSSTGGTNPWTDVAGGNHKHLTYKLKLDTLEYHNQEDTSISFYLRAGDLVCLGSSMVVYKVKAVETATSMVTLEEVVGHVALQTYEENNQMALTLYNEDYSQYHYVEVPLEENRYICVFLSTVQNNVRSIFSDGYLVDLSSIYMKDQSGNDMLDSYGNKLTYLDYYKQYCTNIGDLILGLTQSAYPQLSNYNSTILSDLQSSEQVQTAVSATIDNTTILKVVPINKHLTDDVNSEDIVNLHSQKNEVNAQLSTVMDNIDQTYSVLVSTDFSQNTTVSRLELQANLEKYYTERTTLQKQLNSIIDNINSKASNLNAIADEIKYRVRGITEVSDLEALVKSMSDNKVDIIGCDIEYKYKSTSKDTTSLTVINSSTFTDWNKLHNIDRQRKLVFDDNTQSYRLEFVDYGTTDNIVKWNQIDIPIQVREDVVIRVRYKLNIGQPFVDLYTPWSNEVTMIFPNEYKEDIQLKTILQENEDETVSAAFSKKLINEGYEEHVTNKILSSDQTFFHDADHIYSGFNTSENNLISLKTKLTDMVNDIEKYKTFIENETNAKFSVFLGFDDTEVELSQGYVNRINIYNTDHITGNFIRKNMNLVIKNTGTVRLRLYSMFPGDISTSLISSSIDSYDDQIGNYERVPMLVNNELAAQNLGQWIYFRQTNPYTKADIYYNTEDQRLSDENAAVAGQPYLDFNDLAKKYLDKDNKQVLVAYRRRTPGSMHSAAEINSIVGSLRSLSSWLVEDNPEKKAALQSEMVKKIDGLSTIAELDAFDTAIYNEKPTEFYIYANSLYNTTENQHSDEENKYLMKYEDVKGFSSTGKPVYLDERTPLANYLADYTPIGFSQDSDFNGAFLFPDLVSRAQIQTEGPEKSYVFVDAGESISIPIVFEYYLDGSSKTKISKSLYFDIKNSLVANPVHYLIEVTGNYDLTATGDVFSSFGSLADDVTINS